MKIVYIVWREGVFEPDEFVEAHATREGAEAVVVQLQANHYLWSSDYFVTEEILRD